ncbi:MAG: RNA polymerase subunit sigma-70 [Myxococcota bacterium]
MAIDSVQLEKHRKRLVGHCYRMLGSAVDAEDAVQETMLRAVRSADRFEQRSAVSTWLYRIATRVCLDALARRSRRYLPNEEGDLFEGGEPSLVQRESEHWLEPIPDAWIRNPADWAETKQRVHLAFVVAVQKLSPTQRAAFLLTQVLELSAQEAAATLETSVASVNSAVQRAKANLSGVEFGHQTGEVTEEQHRCARRFQEAFERYDMVALAQLLTDDVTMSMPPYTLWLQGIDSVVGWNTGPGAGCRGSRFVPVKANGQLAFAQYRQGGQQPWSLVTLGFRGGKVETLTYFLHTERIFSTFGLSPTLEI